MQSVPWARHKACPHERGRVFHSGVSALPDPKDAMPNMVRVAGRDFKFEKIVGDLREKDSIATGHLVRQLKTDAGNEGSVGLELLLAAFGREIHAFIYRLSERDRSVADELLFETAHRVLTRIGEFDPSRSAFRTWVYQQAKYAVLDHRRKGSRAPEPIDPDLIDVTLEGEPDPIETLSAAPLSTAEKRALTRAFKKLRPAQRELLWWRFVEGWAPTEIARGKLEGSVPEGHVKVYVARAMKKLSSLYDNEMRQQ
jgi:RNA polymerase sigma factor (sigma-70 family)